MFQTRILMIAPVAFLVLQTTVYVLLVRFTLRDGKRTYIQSSVVFATEIAKAFVSLLFLYHEKSDFKAWLNCIWSDVLDFNHLLEMSGLSLLFTIQNNLGYFAIGSLEAGVFLVMSQLKIMTMAIFVVLILKRRLRPIQWLSLLILTCGVCLMHFQPGKMKKQQIRIESTQQRMRGILAVSVSAMTSGFACVYNEKLLRRRPKSFWITNAQMYIAGSVIALAISFLKDGWRISQEGFFVGFNFHVICISLLSSIGGLSVSIVLKTSGNIAKSFGSSFSVIATTILSHFFFNETLHKLNVVGIMLVVAAVPIFASSGSQKL